MELIKKIAELFMAYFESLVDTSIFEAAVLLLMFGMVCWFFNRVIRKGF